MNVACPNCGTTNRVPADRVDDEPVCGRCQAPLLPAEPVALNDQSLPGYVARTQMPVVVDFWAPWCGPCLAMAPQFAIAAKRLRTVRFVKVDSDASPQSSARLGIRGIPTMVLFEGGQERARISGAMSAPDIESWIASHTTGAAA